MFQTNNLQKLYPHLQFRTPEVTRSKSPIRELLNRPPLPHVPEQVSRVESPPPVVEIALPPVAVEPRVEPRVEPQVEPPVESVVESVVEVEPRVEKRGRKPSAYKPKFSNEQKRDIYLDRLSRKSVHLAEKEITEVNIMLEEIGHNDQKLEELKAETKKRMNLINRAKYFTVSEQHNISNI